MNTKERVYARLWRTGRWTWHVEVITRADGSWMETSWSRTVFGSRTRADAKALHLVRREAVRVGRLRDDRHEVHP